jgi:hypothetical protein
MVTFPSDAPAVLDEVELHWSKVPLDPPLRNEAQRGKQHGTFYPLSGRGRGPAGEERGGNDRRGEEREM